MSDEITAGFALEDVVVRVGDSVLLRDVHIELPSGGFSALVGPSGAGKSTLLRLLNRLLDPSKGRVRWRGRPLQDFDVRALRMEVGLVVQQPRLSAGSAAENLDLPVRLGLVPKAEAAERRAVACELAGLTAAVLGRQQHELSGGERQRVALARTLMLRPRALLLDEPTAALDARSARLLMAALGELRRSAGLTLVMVTHRIEEAAEHCDHLVVLEQGRVAECGPTKQLLQRPQSPALRELLDVTDAPDANEEHDAVTH